jgi:hypothetical protein
MTPSGASTDLEPIRLGVDDMRIHQVTYGSEPEGVTHERWFATEALAHRHVLAIALGEIVADGCEPGEHPADTARIRPIEVGTGADRESDVDDDIAHVAALIGEAETGRPWSEVRDTPRGTRCLDTAVGVVNYLRAALPVDDPVRAGQITELRALVGLGALTPFAGVVDRVRTLINELDRLRADAPAPRRLAMPDEPGPDVLVVWTEDPATGLSVRWVRTDDEAGVRWRRRDGGWMRWAELLEHGPVHLDDPSA